MKTHNIKMYPEYAVDVMTGKKTFEIRFNDRNYKKGDRVLMDAGKGLPVIQADIGSVISYMQKEGYVVFSLLNVVLKDSVKQKYEEYKMEIDISDKEIVFDIVRLLWLLTCISYIIFIMWYIYYVIVVIMNL